MLDFDSIPIKEFKSQRRYRTEVLQYLAQVTQNGEPPLLDYTLRLSDSRNVETFWLDGGLRHPARPKGTEKQSWEAWIVEILRRDLPKKYTGKATWPLCKGYAGPAKLG